MARRPGFTLLELLTVLALLAVLLSALLPVVSKLRMAALKVVCASRLRDLTLACGTYQLREGAYPLQPGTRAAGGGLGLPVLPGVGGGLVLPARPSDMEPAFLNSLQPYLPFPTVAGTDGPERLPPALQCPALEDATAAGRLDYLGAGETRPAFYTGYAYCARPRGTSLSPLIRLLQPERVAGVRPAGRAVLWADDVQWSRLELAYRFAHAVPDATPGVEPLSFADPADLLGQHRAYTDGSVEWLPGHELDLSQPYSTASVSTLDTFFSWF